MPVFNLSQGDVQEAHICKCLQITSFIHLFYFQTGIFQLLFCSVFSVIFVFSLTAMISILPAYFILLLIFISFKIIITVFDVYVFTEFLIMSHKVVFNKVLVTASLQYVSALLIIFSNCWCLSSSSFMMNIFAMNTFHVSQF